MTTAAFFDMDRTLIRANTGTLYLKFLRSRGEISRLRLLQGLAWIAQYKLAVLDMEAVTAKATRTIAGQSEREMIDKCLDFFRHHVKDTVAPKGLEALAQHRRDGHVVAILSSSTPYVTEPLARHLGIEHVLCTRLSIRDGRFDGTHVRPACYGPGKVHWAEAFARTHEVDLSRSFFYTDSYSDLPMLERVGVKRVVNPDTRLLRHARRVGWTVEEW
jgi:HAD superfamily hydrolase (TIGR01490 family)